MASMDRTMTSQSSNLIHWWVNSLKTDQVKQITCKENRVTILLIFAFSCSPIINLRAKKRMEQCKPCVEHG